MKFRTHSGAKKRVKALSSGKVKRKKANRRHLMASKNRKRVLRLGEQAYIDPANMRQIQRQLGIGRA